ncbi:hypothetical protein ACWGS9_09100 [Bradyrhizobium sp. Arg314]
MTVSTDDDQTKEVAADVAGLVSDFLGQKGQELVGQAVSRAILDAKQGTAAGRRPAGPRQPSEKAAPSTKTASQARDKRRVKYLLDGDGGYRQRTDRTARLQQSFRGKGLCSPR